MDVERLKVSLSDRKPISIFLPPVYPRSFSDLTFFLQFSKTSPLLTCSPRYLIDFLSCWTNCNGTTRPVHGPAMPHPFLRSWNPISCGLIYILISLLVYHVLPYLLFQIWVPLLVCCLSQWCALRCSRIIP